MGDKSDILLLFHHIHHDIGEEHEVHHCGGEHAASDSDLDYNIAHCSCGKHRVDKNEAIGHDFYGNKQLVKFTEGCPDGGWHVESGIIKI